MVFVYVVFSVVGWIWCLIAGRMLWVRMRKDKKATPQ
jgi:hypothetical protein